MQVLRCRDSDIIKQTSSLVLTTVSCGLYSKPQEKIMMRHSNKLKRQWNFSFRVIGSIQPCLVIYQYQTTGFIFVFVSVTSIFLSSLTLKLVKITKNGFKSVFWKALFVWLSSVTGIVLDLPLWQAKERELELKNNWADNKLTRRQTQAKYGF